MFKFKLRPFMDAEGDVGSGSVTTQDTDTTDTMTDTTDEGAADQTSADQNNTKVKQTPDQDHAFAQMRREAEQAKREAQEARQALQQRDQWVAQKFGQSHGITTWDQYQQALAFEEQQAKEAAMREQGIDPNLVKQMLQQDPEFQNLKQIAMNAQQQLAQQQGQAQLDSQLKELSSEHPDIKEVNDLFKLPNYADLESKVRSGYSLLDAYEAVNRAEIKRKATEAAKQKTLNNLSGKSHLKTEGDGSGDPSDSHIDADTLQMYLDQGMSKADAQKYHKKLYG